ncbi:MAG: class I mannose-6-phosphate isomerase [Clostridia bacterium]|nr:class I mannose-6-phosphate isomerase [Clostridia bacterium]
MPVYKLIPKCKDYLWGGEKLKTKYGKKTDKTPCAESWELSFHKDGLTGISGGGTLAEVISEEDKGINCKNFPFFPVLIKFIDAKDNLSVQVHPSDEYALKYENSFGKIEMWYIVEAEKGAGIYCGFREDTDKEKFVKKLADGTVEDLLNFIPVKKGESYFIEAGTVHAIGKGCLICEIQQNSNLTYRVYDYNRIGKDGKKRDLHTDKALKVINFGKYKPVVFGVKDKAGERTLADCKYFRVKETELNGRKEFTNGNSFMCFNVIDGNGDINGESFKKGNSFFATAGQRVILSGKATVLLTDVPKQ